MMIVLEAVTSILASIISGQPQFDAIPTVSAAGLQELAETLPAACAPINTAALVLDILIRPAASPAVCPTVRYLVCAAPLFRPPTAADPTRARAVPDVDVRNHLAAGGRVCPVVRCGSTPGK